MEVLLVMANSLEDVPAATPAHSDEATKGYSIQHAAYRITNVEASIDFYTKILGMKVLSKTEFPGLNTTSLFLGYEDVEDAPEDPVERFVWSIHHKPLLELVHHGFPTGFTGHHSGPSEPFGYGHIGILVDDVHKAAERLLKMGVEFVMYPEKEKEGVEKTTAMFKDPDGYILQIFDVEGARETMSTFYRS